MHIASYLESPDIDGPLLNSVDTVLIQDCTLGLSGEGTYSNTTQREIRGGRTQLTLGTKNNSSGMG